MSVFRDKTVFNKVDTPQPVGRENEIQQAVSEFTNPVNTVIPSTAIFYGQRKAGKSAVLQKTCAQLDHLATGQNIDIEIVYVDCKSITNRRDLFFEILQKQGCKKPGGIASEKRKYTTYTWLMQQLTNHVRQREADFYIFSIDDIHAIEESTEALESLIHIHNEYGVPNVGILATSSDFRLVDDSFRLSGKYRPTGIHLSFLNDSAYQRALEASVDVGFKDNSITDDAFQRLFEWGRETAHIGEAVEILSRAGERATEETANQVTEQHIEQAIEDFNMLLGVRWILDRAFDIHNQGILLALANSDQQPIRTKQLYERYESIFEEIDTSPLSYRQFRTRILQEDLLDPFLSTEKKNRGRQGGVSFEIQLHDDPEMVYTALNHESYRELPRSHLPDRDESQFRNLSVEK